MQRMYLCLSIILLSFLSTQVYAEKVFTFGIVPQQSASKLARLWTPILRDISQKTGVKIVFRTATNIPTFEKRLAKGEYDFAYMNPYHYTVFSQNPGYHAFAKAKDKKIKGIIVVNKNSGIQTLEELKGQTLAFPSPAAFAASILTRSQFTQADIPITPKYVSSHDSVYQTVAKGIYPAGGGVVRTLNNAKGDVKDQLRVLWTTKGFTPHAFAAHNRVDADVVKLVLKEMMALEKTPEGRHLLASIKIKGVVQADNADWDDVRALQISLLNQFTQ